MTPDLPRTKRKLIKQYPDEVEEFFFASVATPPRKRRKLDRVHESQADADTAHSNAKDSATPRLGQSSRKSRRKPLCGVQHRVKQLPMAVHLLVFSYLEPFDLLRISCASTEFRAVVVRHPSLWRIARQNFAREHADLPDVPPTPKDVSEPAFINLLFGRHCSNCHKVTSLSQWEAYMRLCRKCFYKPEVSGFSNDLEAGRSTSDLTCVIDQVPQFLICSRRFYHTDSLRLMVNALERHGLTKFVNSDMYRVQREKMAAICEHASLCEQFVRAFNNEHLRERSRVRQQRFESIVARLAAEGWQKELEYKSTRVALQKHRNVNTGHPFTEAVWKSIGPNVRFFMEAQRARRIARLNSFGSLFKEATAKLDAATFKPNAIDVAYGDVFHAMIFETDLDDDVAWPDIHLSLFTVGILEDICAAIRDEMDTELRRLLDTEDLADCDLDRVVFECSKCGLLFCYPAVMNHSCCCSTDGTFEHALHSEFKWRSEDFLVDSYRPSSEESV
ncbi:hypothetical protein BDZ89DRAFT_1167214 [Hymenopellis radicata]|nr:hypothetical protein BDZ89DRAFT_1167214 [Hymenopellis radicata]